jgi:hypothetical protein
MKLPITIEYNSGEQATYIAQPPEWAKWEKQTGNTIGQAKEKIVKPMDAWMETVADVIVGDADDPKVIQKEA